MKHILCLLTILTLTVSVLGQSEIISTTDTAAKADTDASGSGEFHVFTKNTKRVVVKNNGYAGFGVADPTAIIDLKQPADFIPQGNDLFIRFRPNDPLSADFGIGLAAAPNQFSAQNDTALVWGYNVINSGGKQIETQPQLYFRMENLYTPAEGIEQMEMYIGLSGKAAGSTFRPWGWTFQQQPDGSSFAYHSIGAHVEWFNSGVAGSLQPAMMSWSPSTGALTFHDYGSQYTNPIPFLSVPNNRPFIKTQGATLLETLSTAPAPFASQGGVLSLAPGGAGLNGVSFGRNVPSGSHYYFTVGSGSNPPFFGHDGQKWVFSNTGTPGAPTEVIDDELTGRFIFEPQTITLGETLGDWTQLGVVSPPGYASMVRVTIFSTSNPYRAKTYVVRGTYTDIASGQWWEVTPDTDTGSHVAGNWALDYNGTAIRVRNTEVSFFGGFNLRVLVEAPAPQGYTTNVQTGTSGTINGTKSRGVTVSGSNCTITSIRDGLVVNAVCQP